MKSLTHPILGFSNDEPQIPTLPHSPLPRRQQRIASGARSKQRLPWTRPTFFPPSLGRIRPPSLPFFFPEPPSPGSGRWRPRPVELAPALDPVRRREMAEVRRMAWPRWRRAACRGRARRAGASLPRAPAERWAAAQGRALRHCSSDGPPLDVCVVSLWRGRNATQNAYPVSVLC